jgi:hypothetical protein
MSKTRSATTAAKRLNIYESELRRGLWSRVHELHGVLAMIELATDGTFPTDPEASDEVAGAIQAARRMAGEIKSSIGVMDDQILTTARPPTR